MTAAEQRERAAVCAEARGWVGTPYHHRGRIKGPQGGVDCAQLVWCVFHACGLAPFRPLEAYPPDWMLNRSAERYLDAVRGEARAVAVPQPGDVALYRFGRCFAHGAIVLDPGWPAIVHAHRDAKAVILDRGDSGRLHGRAVHFFSKW